jgi:hypothetical protein
MVASDVFYKHNAWAAWLGISFVFFSIAARGLYAIFFMLEETDLLTTENVAQKSKELWKWYFSFTFTAAFGFGLLGYAVFT